jgi:disulfide bond formation protein DsbB
MTPLLVSNLLAILTLAAAAGTIVILALVVVGRRDRVQSLIGGSTALWLAALVAVVSTAGSLYFSEVAGYLPCLLCWYQRIAMYPLAVILPIAAIRHDDAVRPYAAALAGIGAVIAAYHTVLQRFPDLPSASCALNNPCSAIHFERFGFVTLPVMALVGFLAILTLLLATRGQPSEVTP